MNCLGIFRASHTRSCRTAGVWGAPEALEKGLGIVLDGVLEPFGFENACKSTNSIQTAENRGAGNFHLAALLYDRFVERLAVVLISFRNMHAKNLTCLRFRHL